MKKRILYILWGWLYLLCAALGHLENPEGMQAAALTVLSLLFFVPGFLLLYAGWREKSKKTLDTIFYICLASLVLTVCFLLANVLSVTGSETLGKVLYVFLIWVSAPMVCSGYWFLSLFLWAFLLFSAKVLKKRL